MEWKLLFFWERGPHRRRLSVLLHENKSVRACVRECVRCVCSVAGV